MDFLYKDLFYSYHQTFNIWIGVMICPFLIKIWFRISNIWLAMFSFLTNPLISITEEEWLTSLGPVVGSS